MEAEKELDPFASIVKLCQPTASQEDKLRHCHFAREFENFADSYPSQWTSSIDPTQSGNTQLFVMVSPPDEGVFVTPPEHHSHLHHSSSEDQNVGEGLKTVGTGDGSGGTKNVRVLELGIVGEPAVKKIRVDGEGLDGGTVPAVDTEMVVIDGDQDVRDDEVTVLGDAEVRVHGEDLGGGTVPLVDTEIVEIEGNEAVHDEDVIEVGSARVVRKTDEMKDGVNSNSSGRLRSSEIIKLTCIGGDRSAEVIHGGIENVVKMPKDGSGDGGPKSDGKRIEEIDKFRYSGDIDRTWKGKAGGAVGDGSGRRKRQLPESLQGKEKNAEGSDTVVEPAAETKGEVSKTGVEPAAETKGESSQTVVEPAVETKGGLLDFLEIVKIAVGADLDDDDDGEDVDFLETAKKRGMIFPTPRWWPPEGW